MSTISLQETQLTLRYVDRPYTEGQRPTSGRGKKAISQIEYSFVYAMVMLLYRTLQITLGYDTIIWRTWIGCKQQFCIHNCDQTAADRDGYY